MKKLLIVLLMSSLTWAKTSRRDDGHGPGNTRMTPIQRDDHGPGNGGMSFNVMLEQARVQSLHLLATDNIDLFKMVVLDEEPREIYLKNQVLMYSKLKNATITATNKKLFDDFIPDGHPREGKTLADKKTVLISQKLTKNFDVDRLSSLLLHEAGHLAGLDDSEELLNKIAANLMATKEEYFMAKFGFKFKAVKGLDVEEDENGNVMISNSSLIAPGEKTSYLKFSEVTDQNLLKANIIDTDTLREALEHFMPFHELTIIEYNGMHGYMLKANDFFLKDEKLKYILLTEQKKLIQADIDISEGIGSELVRFIASILKSDEEIPVLHEIKKIGDWTSGSKSAALRIRVSDNSSGVNWIRTDFKSSGTNCVAVSTPFFKAIGNNWYEAKLSDFASQHDCNGLHQLSKIEINDHAHNEGAWKAEGKFYSGTRVPIFTINIINKNFVPTTPNLPDPDREFSSKIIEMNLSEGSTPNLRLLLDKAGKDTRVNITLEKKECRRINISLKREGTTNWYSENIVLNTFDCGGFYKITTIQSNNPSHNRSYTSTSGSYYYQYENSGYIKTEFPVLTVNFPENPNLDIAKPIIEEIKIVGSALPLSTDTRLFVKTYDVGPAGIRYVGCRIGWEHFGKSYDGGNYKRPEVDCYRDFKDEGDGWYSVQMNIGPYVASGKILVEGITVEDKANNRAELGIRAENGVYPEFYFLNGWTPEGKSSNFPRLYLDVKR